MRLLGILLVLTACGSPEAEPVPELSWYGDVEAISQRVCASCHNPGAIGPGDLSTYEGAVAMAPMMRLALEAGTMPPPASDPECAPYQGSEHLNLTEEERTRMLDWIDAGTPAGDVTRSLGAYERPFEHLEGADLILELPMEHTLKPDATGNEYVCFVLNDVLTEDQYFTGFEHFPDNLDVVHHAILFRDTNGDAGKDYGAEGQTTFPCADPILEGDWEFLHAWAPGAPPTALEEGLGLRVEAGDQLVIQMHYFHTGDDVQTDRSRYAVRTSTEPHAEMFMFPAGPYDLDIPAGAPAHVESDSFENDFGVNIAIHGVAPHMHRLGTHYEAELEKASGGTQCVVRGEWDFDHQFTYMFDEPLLYEVGDTLRGSCTWDNSADNPAQAFDPPQDITFGEGTTDEMCLFLTYASIRL